METINGFNFGGKEVVKKLSGEFVRTKATNMQEWNRLEYLVRKAHEEYLEYSSPGMVQSVLDEEVGTDETMVRQSLDRVLDEVDEGIDERTMEVANQVVEMIGQESQDMRDHVFEGIRDFRLTFEQALDTMARREDVQRLTGEMDQVSSFLKEYE